MSLRNPMQANASPLVGVHIDVQESKENILTATCQLGLTTPVEVINELETTDFIGLDDLPDSANARHAIYAGLISKLNNENGKHFILPNPLYSKEVLNYINTKIPGYSDKKAAETRLLYTNFDLIEACKGLDSNEYSLQCLESKDEMACVAVANFQMDRLVAMRPSQDEADQRRKLAARYSIEALKQKAQSGKIIVYYVTNKENEMLATMVINAHSVRDKSPLDRAAYISDLILAQGYTEKEGFVQQFMISMIKHYVNPLITEEKSKLHFSLMAPGSITDPLVICIQQLMKIGLLKPLDAETQVNLGVIAYFVYDTVKNTAKMNANRNTPASLFYYNPRGRKELEDNTYNGPCLSGC